MLLALLFLEKWQRKSICNGAGNELWQFQQRCGFSFFPCQEANLFLRFINIFLFRAKKPTGFLLHINLLQHNSACGQGTAYGFEKEVYREPFFCHSQMHVADVPVGNLGLIRFTTAMSCCAIFLQREGKETKHKQLHVCYWSDAGNEFSSTTKDHIHGAMAPTTAPEDEAFHLTRCTMAAEEDRPVAEKIVQVTQKAPSHQHMKVGLLTQDG